MLQTEYSEGRHVVPVEAPDVCLGGGQAVVSEVTVDHHNLRVGVLQLVRDPALRAGDQFLLNHIVREVYDSVTEIIEPADHESVDCEELLGVSEVEEEDVGTLRSGELVEEPVGAGLLVLVLGPPAGQAVDEDEAHGQDEGGRQAGAGDEGEVGLGVGAGRDGLTALAGDVDRFIPERWSADLGLPVQGGVRASVTVGMVHWNIKCQTRIGKQMDFVW